MEVCLENFVRKTHLFYSTVTDAVYLYCTRCYQKVPEMYQNEKVDTMKVLIATVPFKVVPLGAYTTIRMFLPQSEVVLKVLSCQHLQHLLRFSLDLLCGIKSTPLQLAFRLGEGEEIPGG